MRFNICPSLIA